MKNKTLRFLSLISVLILLCTMFIFPSSAAITGSTVTGSVTSVEKLVDVEDDYGDLSQDCNIYKVVVHVESSNPVAGFDLVVSYDKAVFRPVYGEDGSFAWNDYPDDGMVAAEGNPAACTWLGNLGIDTGWTATGAVTTKKAATKYAGASNTNQPAEQLTANMYYEGNGIHQVKLEEVGYTSADVDKYGVITLAYAPNLSVDGSLLPKLNDDYVEIYFKAIGDINGTEIKVGGSFATITNPTTRDWLPGEYFYSNATAIPDGFETKAFVPYTYTAPVPAGPTITKLGSQIRFNGLESAPGANDADFDIRTRAKVSKADMITLLGTTEAGLQAALKTADIRMGFVYQATVNGSFVADDAKAAAIAGKDQGTYYVKDVKYAAFEGDDILWTCFIDDAKYDGEVIALPYIILGEEAYFLDGTITCNFGDGYRSNYDKYAATQS